MNLQVLTPSRKAPRQGDVFVVRLLDGRYFHGLVFDTSAVASESGAKNLIAVVIFATGTSEKLPVPELSSMPALVGPRITNRLSWSRGYFEKVGEQPEAKVPAHCFEDARGRYFDSSGHPLSRRRGTADLRGVYSFRTFDVAISLALGLPLPPADPPTRRRPR